MHASEPEDLFAPDRAALSAILLFAITSGVLLLIAHEAIADKAAWFASPTLRTLWFTLATAPPLLAALTVQRLADRRFIGGLLGYVALLIYLAWYGGRAIEPEHVAIGAVVLPFGWVLIASGHVLTAWFSVWLTRSDFAYPRLFEAAWRHLSTVLQVLAYTGAFWLLLFLWAALFRALGIVFFEDLFGSARFAYPVTSLVAGYGLVLARSKSSIGDAVHLRILALWRGLLPLAAVLALAFAAALAVQGVQPLWATRHATQLLLALILALVALSNAAYGKGSEPPPHPVLKRLVQAALLLLPLFAALSAWALWLRWQQYGMSLDRLWAALSIAIASLYALGYALAAARRSTPWLAGIAPVNRAASLITAVALLLTQTGLLDFRAMTAHALRDRGAALKAEDLRYLRWELGSPGITALEHLQAQADTPRRDEIATLLARRSRYGGRDEELATGAANLRLPPNQAEAPAALLERALEQDAIGAKPCYLPHSCWLLKADVLPDVEDEWLRIRLPAETGRDYSETVEWVIYLPCKNGTAWCTRQQGSDYRPEASRALLREALDQGDFAAAKPEVLDLRVGKAKLPLSR